MSKALFYKRRIEQGSKRLPKKAYLDLWRSLESVSIVIKQNRENHTIIYNFPEDNSYLIFVNGKMEAYQNERGQEMKNYETRVRELENEGLTRSDAQAVVDLEILKENKEKDKNIISQLKKIKEAINVSPAVTDTVFMPKSNTTVCDEIDAILQKMGVSPDELDDENKRLLTTGLTIEQAEEVDFYVDKYAAKMADNKSEAIAIDWAYSCTDDNEVNKAICEAILENHF